MVTHFFYNKVIFIQDELYSASFDDDRSISLDGKYYTYPDRTDAFLGHINCDVISSNNKGDIDQENCIELVGLVKKIKEIMIV